MAYFGYFVEHYMHIFYIKHFSTTTFCYLC